MLKLFRRIRSKLLDEGKTKRYLIYAIGEILLVVIGILIALQINNWNEEQKAIKAKHEKYSAIILDLQRDLIRQGAMKFAAGLGKEATKGIANGFFNDSLSNGQHNIDGLMYILDYYSYVKNNHGHLTGELTDKEVTDQLADYLYFQNAVDKALAAQNVLAEDFRAYFANNGYLNLKSVNSIAFSDDSKAPLVNPEKLVKLSKDEVFQGLIIRYNMVSQRMIDKISGLMKANQQLQVTLAEHINQTLYNDVGIIGSALPDGWDRSVAMNPTDSRKNSWKITLDLEDGEVKFRVNNEWDLNWGGDRFPEGELDFGGSNIPVKKGRYLIRADLVNLSYSFNKVNQ